jgi:hypothetical protein
MPCCIVLRLCALHNLDHGTSDLVLQLFVLKPKDAKERLVLCGWTLIPPGMGTFAVLDVRWKDFDCAEGDF